MFEDFKVPQELVPSDPRFGVGPSLIPVSVIESLAKTGPHLLGTSHRKEAVKNLVKELQEGIKKYFKLPEGYEVVLGNGGATTFWDIMGLGLVEKNSLHFITGEFSDKWFKAHQLIPWIKATDRRVPMGSGMNPVEEEGFDFICTTLNETSTGVMITEIPKLKNLHTLMAVDATSGAGQMKVDFNLVDVYYFSPQKVFASEGGTFVAIFSPKAIARARAVASDKSRYIPESLKLVNALDMSVNHQTYNTPSISNFFFMNEQIKIMNALGEDEVIAQAKRKAQFIYDWAAEKSYLSAYIKEEKFRSHAVATIDVDDKYSVDDLASSLRKQKVVYDIESYRKLGRNQLRISLFHNVSFENIVKLTKIIDAAVSSQK
jgi:phosphoserine aminotransferase